MSDTSNVCVFCYESLLDGQNPVGVAVPCGHCFHQECWASYVESKQSSEFAAAPRIKCPTCQGRVNSLGKLFLDFDCISPAANDDDLSLGTDDGLDGVVTNEKNSQESDDSSEQIKGKEIIVVDEEDTEERNTDLLSKVRKYKAITSRWKKSRQQSEAENSTLRAENRSLNSKVDDLTSSLEEKTEELEYFRGEVKVLSQRAEQLQWTVDNQGGKLKRLQAELIKNEAILQSTRTELQKAKSETEKARKSYVVEAEELLTEHPVLVSKVKKLQEENKSLRAQLQNDTHGKPKGFQLGLARAGQKKVLREVSVLREREMIPQRIETKQIISRKKQPRTSGATKSGLDLLDSRTMSTGLHLLGKKRQPCTNNRRSTGEGSLLSKKHKPLGDGFSRFKKKRSTR